MLERIVDAVHSARIMHLIRELEGRAEAWRKLAAKAQEPLRFEWRERSAALPDLERFAVVSPTKERGSAVFSYGPSRDADEFAIVYESPREEESVTYVVRGRGYMRLAQYATARRNVFYVHVPSWASIRTVSEQEMGRHILGTANISNGQIRLLESLDPAQRTEVLLHETMHLLYPMHSEGQIRDLVRNIMGKQYCHFH